MINLRVPKNVVSDLYHKLNSINRMNKSTCSGPVLP